MKKKPNLLLLGASGNVSNAFLHYLPHHRDLFNNLILLDKRNNVLSDPYINHKALNYKFIKKKINLPEEENKFISFLKKNKIDIVLDLTDADSIPLIETVNKAGINYINTALNDDKKSDFELMNEVYPKKKLINKAAHILCSGMNPGVVNMWVGHGIEKYGVPKEIIHFEYDTSKVSKREVNVVTWSLHEFLVEVVRDPAGISIGRYNAKQMFPDALKNREDMTPILKPIMKLSKYPKGYLVLHEESLSISKKYNIPSRFIYAINPYTMKKLAEIYKKKKNVLKRDLILGDNLHHILDGADSIGVVLDYKDKKVYYFNSMPNLNVIGTNGTNLQVIVGVYSALFTILFNKLKPGTYFVEDLYDTYYKNYMFDNLRTEQFVFSKANGKLKLKSYIPEVKVKYKNKLEHFYI